MSIAPLVRPDGSIAQANAVLREGLSMRALVQYFHALHVSPELEKFIAPNIKAALKGLRPKVVESTPQFRVGVCGWNLSMNAAGRVFALAHLYEQFAQVEIIGCLFSSAGHQVWEPFRQSKIPVHAFLVKEEANFLLQAIELVVAHPYELVHLSKPRLPNVILGVLYKLIWGSQVIMDIDDEELAFVNESTPCSVFEWIGHVGELPKAQALAGKEWTRIAVGLARGFDGVTVSNTALQERYGGVVIHHARDEALYQPSPARKHQNRKKFGIALDKKVVLFLGTPRPHKGLTATAQAIASLNRPDILLLIVGEFADPKAKSELQATGAQIQFLPNQPFALVPDILAIADACVLMQDTTSPVTPWQVPAKMSDALAMQVPVVATDTPALRSALLAGALLSVTVEGLGPALLRVLDDAALRQQLQSAGRSYFESQLSFSINRLTLQKTIADCPKAALSYALRDLIYAGRRSLWIKPLRYLLEGAPYSAVQAPKAPSSTHLDSPGVAKIAFVVHVYYPELWQEIADRLLAIEHPFDLYVTTCAKVEAPVRSAVLAAFPTATVKVFANIGMDILPFLSLVNLFADRGYTAVCKLHTKKGDGVLAAQWRTAMLDALIGTPVSVQLVAQAFAADSLLQLVGPAEYFQSARKLMLDNEPAVNNLYAGLSGQSGRVSVPGDWGFFAGTMFWARPTLLKPLAEIVLNAPVAKFEPETVKLDGQFVHAIERVFGLLPALFGGKIGLLHKGSQVFQSHNSVLQKVCPGVQLAVAPMSALAHQHQALASDANALRKVALFDDAYYLEQNPMLEGLGVDLIAHYLLIGRFKGASPHPDFDPAHYLQLHGRLLRGAKDPFTHFVQEGASKGLGFNNWQPGLGSKSTSLRFQILGKLLLDWDAEKRKPRNQNLVSIIVPVYNQGELTKACIESLYQHTTHELFELIIVDNGSDAPTQQILRDCQARWPSLHIARNEENLNFSLGCNMGFKASHGEVVIFLNNDTTVTPDWLNPLVELLDKPGVAAVQPKLLYPDGSIQCMGIEFTTEGFFGYPVKNQTSTAPDGLEGNKGLLAVSGACMAMRAHGFAKSMGFDPIYVNGQEDVDLCLRLNLTRGEACCLAAFDSRVIHHESRSTGRHKHVKNNRTDFARRWLRATPAAFNSLSLSPSSLPHGQKQLDGSQSV